MWKDYLHKKKLICPLQITLCNLFQQALKDLILTGTKFEFLHLKIRLNFSFMMVHNSEYSYIYASNCFLPIILN